MSEQLKRNSTFSYVCNGCSRCCIDKSIQVNPYEIARLSRNQALTTGDFIQQHLADDGPFLKKRSDGACVFLGPEGCRVHKDRPLVCRLYPLGREVTPEGEELFRTVDPHPETEGVYGTNGDIEGFLETQDATIFIEAADRYHALVDDLLSFIDLDQSPGAASMVQDWLDMEEVLSHTDASEPNDDLESKMAAHIGAIRDLATNMTGE